MESLERTRSLAQIIEQHRPPLAYFEEVYRDLHRNPELSRQEIRTSKIAAEHLESLGVYTVHTGIGGHGVVGVFENGDGPKVLLRADMDALPVKEQTGLDYASTATGTDPEGKQVPVMHACGHDMHVTPLMALASTLAACKSFWKGTVILLFQPAEEFCSGAQAMVDDGLYGTKWNIPVPDVVLGQHVLPFKTGQVAIAPGPVFTAIDSLFVRIFGVGGHGSRPDLCIDPVLTAAHIVVRLQSIVTREVHPSDTAVITCGSVQGGDASNIIPAHADIKLTMRSFKPEVHERVLNAIHRVVKAEAAAAGCIKEPEISTIVHAPATVNEEIVTATLTSAFKNKWGDDCIHMVPQAVSEDFSVLARAVDKPYCFWVFGGVDEKTWDKAVADAKVNELPFNHSPFFAPVVQPTLTTGIDAMALAALTFLKSA